MLIAFREKIPSIEGLPNINDTVGHFSVNFEDQSIHFVLKALEYQLHLLLLVPILFRLTPFLVFTHVEHVGTQVKNCLLVHLHHFVFYIGGCLPSLDLVWAYRLAKSLILSASLFCSICALNCLLFKNERHIRKCISTDTGMFSLISASIYWIICIVEALL